MPSGASEAVRSWWYRASRRRSDDGGTAGVTAQELSRIAGAIALAAVLVIAGLVAWSTLRTPEQEFVPQLAGGPAMGSMTGYLGRVDRNAHTIDVAEDRVGVRAVSLAVTNDTAITVHGKAGGLVDLSKDMPVRVFYEVRNDVKYVTAIQVVAEEPRATHANATAASGPEGKDSTEAKPAGAQPLTDQKPVAESKPIAETKPVAETTPPGDSRPVGESKPVPVTKPAGEARAVPPVPSPATPVPSPRTQPGPTSSVQAPAPPAVKPSRPAPSPTEAAPAAPARTATTPQRPTDSDVIDGTAAIDWLLKGPGRR
jgi:hypothetical protein